jgi:alkanesulfonate monooxygenase SsuD/methylene tetrahydromethanopterin reductase-like flavin-dependent oxidoreductase (luciferase family)
MRFGLFGGPAAEPGREDGRHAYHRFADYAVEAESLGFVSVFLTEHHFTGLGQASSPLTLLAHLAARTTTMRLGTAVTVLPWYNPIMAAEQAATVDVLSNGRLDFGIGRGFRAAEFEGFGQSMQEASERHEEALEVILRAWTTEVGGHITGASGTTRMSSSSRRASSSRIRRSGLEREARRA